MLTNEPTTQNKDSEESRRRYMRSSLAQAATLTTGRWFRKRSISAKLVNISLTGATVELGQESDGARPGDGISVICELPTDLGFPIRPKKYKLPGTLVRKESISGESQRYSIKFRRLIPERVQQIESRPQRFVTLLLGLGLVAGIAFLRIHNLTGFWYAPVFHTYSIVVCAYVLIRVFLSLFYKEPRDLGFLPSISIVIPVKDEEKHIADAIRRCVYAKYPMDLREVIVVNDGSTDRTPQILDELKERYPALRVYHFPVNRGKRHAMAYGAEQAEGDVLIYVDSDSLIDPEALYRIVQPFADPSIGAVAGHVRVALEPTLFSKMEFVRYHISQRIIRASESLFGTVTCCCGALAAYRRSVVLKNIPVWLNQTFRGTRATFGDDRSLTNHILKTHRVIYHSGAAVDTYVPSTWKKFIRQQLRWKKSWSRESFIASTILWRRHPVTAVLFYVGIALTLLSPLVAARALVYLPIAASVSPFNYLLGLGLVNMLFACFCFYFTRSRYWPYMFAFVILYIGFLCWQTYYAILTIPKNHWGTR